MLQRARAKNIIRCERERVSAARPGRASCAAGRTPPGRLRRSAASAGSCTRTSTICTRSGGWEGGPSRTNSKLDHGPVRARAAAPDHDWRCGVLASSRSDDGEALQAVPALAPARGAAADARARTPLARLFVARRRPRERAEGPSLMAMQAGRTSVSIVVPAFNEEARLGATLIELSAYLPGSRGSGRSGSSTTARPMEHAGSSRTTRAGMEPRVVLQREPHRGKGGAVKAGLLAARGGLPLHLRCGSVDARVGAAAVPAAEAEGVRRRDRQPGGLRRASRSASRCIRHLAGRDVQFRRAAPVGAGDRGYSVRVQDVHRRRRRSDLSAGARRRLGLRHRSAVHRARPRGCGSSRCRSSGTIARASQVSLLRDGVGMFRELMRIRGNRARRGAYDRTGEPQR